MKKEKKKRERRGEKKKGQRKARRCKGKQWQGAALLHGQEKAGKSLGGLPPPEKDSWACCPCPIAAAASQIMFIALK